MLWLQIDKLAVRFWSRSLARRDFEWLGQFLSQKDFTVLALAEDSLHVDEEVAYFFHLGDALWYFGIPIHKMLCIYYYYYIDK